MEPPDTSTLPGTLLSQFRCHITHFLLFPAYLESASLPFYSRDKSGIQAANGFSYCRKTSPEVSKQADLVWDFLPSDWPEEQAHGPFGKLQVSAEPCDREARGLRTVTHTETSDHGSFPTRKGNGLCPLCYLFPVVSKIESCTLPL